MSIHSTRRQTLKIVAQAGVVSYSGCLDSRSEIPDSTSDLDVADWPMFQHDSRNTGRNSTVTAVPEDGTRRWRVERQVSTPTVAGGTIYVADFTNQRSLIARELSTGREQWRSAIPHGQVGPAPAVSDDSVVHHSFGMIHAFGRERGEERWTYNPGSGTPSAPVVVDDTVYIGKSQYGNDPAKVIAISMEDGAERWKRLFQGDSVTWLAYNDETLFLGSSQGFVAGISPRDGTERWRFDSQAGVTRAPSTAKGVVYATDNAGNLYALHTETGEKQWQIGVSEGGSPSSPIIGNDTVYTGTETGLTAVNTVDGTLRWEFLTDGPAGLPTTDGDAVYFGGTDWNDHAIHALDAESGEQRWSHETEERKEGDHTVVGVVGPPVPVEGHLLVAAADGLTAVESA